MDKKAIRARMRTERKALASEVRKASDAAISRELCARVEKGALRAPFAVYLASADEIDLAPFLSFLLKRGEKVVSPRWNGAAYDLAVLDGLDDSSLRVGPMSIKEPAEAKIVSSSEVMTWIVPGLAFSPEGGRLGYGGGWYDRFLADKAPSAVTIGVARPFQKVAHLPLEPHDICLNDVIFL